MNELRARLGYCDVDGLAWEENKQEQKYCETCDLAPKTAMNNCKKCGNKLELINLTIR